MSESKLIEEVGKCMVEYKLIEEVEKQAELYSKVEASLNEAKIKHIEFLAEELLKLIPESKLSYYYEGDDEGGELFIVIIKIKCLDKYFSLCFNSDFKHEIKYEEDKFNKLNLSDGQVKRIVEIVSKMVEYTKYADKDYLELLFKNTGMLQS